MAPLAPGSKLGPYEIVAPIGAGGMGEVYRARDPRLGRDVALKVLPEAVAGHAERLARFQREARTLATLNHPHIVTIYSIEEAGAVRFLTMELVEGQSLDRVVEPGGLPLARALDLGIALADALAAAHERGVVHRDLKPGNVMVARDGRLKVLDFGLAKVDTARAADIEGTQALTLEAPISTTGTTVGTVPYMAPEQVRGETVDARADIFAFGIMLYELLTGRRPFSGGTYADVSSAILRDTPVPIQTIRAELPRDLERIVGRCLEKDRERRFQTAKDVRNELEIVRRDANSGTAPVAATAAPSRAAVGPPTADVPSVAVLPFANRSRDEEDEYFSDGLADELLNVLAKIRGLRVAARTSSSSFKGKQTTIAEVGRALNVATVLEGSVRKAGNRVRISVQLVKVSDGYPLWSETYDRTLNDIFAVQDDIAQSVVKELRTTLLGEDPGSQASGEARTEVAAAAKGRGGNAEAHRLYLQGKYFVDRLNPEDNRKGIGYLLQAVDLDPGNAPAWVYLALAHVNGGAFGWGPVAESFRGARDAVERAVALAPNLPEAHVILSRIHRIHDWDWKKAEAASRRALELAPGSAEVLTETGVLAGQLGRPEESVNLLQRAVAQDPLSSSAYSQLGYGLRSMGRSAEAIEAYRKALDIAPQRISAHHLIAILLSDRGQHEEALAEANLEPAEWARLTTLAYVHHKAGRRADSDRALDELKERFAQETAIQIAAIHSARGEADDAFAWLDRALAQRDPGMSQVQCEPTIRALHDDPRWKVLLAKLGFDV